MAAGAMLAMMTVSAVRSRARMPCAFVVGVAAERSNTIAGIVVASCRSGLVARFRS